MTLISAWMDSLGGVDRDEWNAAVARCGFYLSYDWLLAEERRDDATSRYFVLRRSPGDDIVAAVPLSVVHRESGARYHPHRIGLPGATDGPFGLVGSRRGYRSGLLVNARDARERYDISLALGSAVHEFSRTHGVPVYALYVPEELLADVMGVPGCGRAAHVGTEAFLPLDGRSYADTVACLSGGRRHKLRRERERFRAAGYQVALESPKGLEPEMAQLLANVEARYGTENPVSFYRYYYERLTESADPGHLLTCRTSGNLVGFIHFYVFADRIWCRTAGFDYSRLQNAFEYFNLAFYETAEVANRFGARSIHFGMESIEAKVNHGSVVSSLWALTFPGPDA